VAERVARCTAGPDRTINHEDFDVAMKLLQAQVRRGRTHRPWLDEDCRRRRQAARYWTPLA
jgi:hypothetical protein